MKRMIVFLILCMGISVSLMARDVNIVMKNGDLKKGELIGISSGVVYVKTSENKVEQLKTVDVAQLFDAKSGEKIEFAEQSEATLPPTTAPTTVPTLAHSTVPTLVPALEQPPPAVLPQETPAGPVTQQEEVMKAESVPPPYKPAFPPRGLRSKYEDKHFIIEAALSTAFGTSNNQSVVNLYRNLVPLEAYSDINKFFMTLDLNFLVKPFNFMAVGPFFTWRPVSPGYADTVVYPGGTYTEYWGHTAYVYSYPDITAEYNLNFNTIDLGGSLRFNLLTVITGDFTNTIYLQGDLGIAALVDSGFNVNINSDDPGVYREPQQVDFYGSAPIERILAGFGFIQGNVGVDLKLGYQMCTITNIKYKIIRNDFDPSIEGETGTLWDNTGDRPVSVDYNSVVIYFNMTFMF
jgi:hypothetical protein